MSCVYLITQSTLTCCMGKACHVIRPSIHVMLFNLNLYESFCPHITNSFCLLLVIIFTMSSLNFLSYILTGFGALFQPFSRLFPMWDKQVISKLHFLCSSMTNFMWMSIENAIELWINDQKINYILKHALEEPIAI